MPFALLTKFRPENKYKMQQNETEGADNYFFGIRQDSFSVRNFVSGADCNRILGIPNSARVPIKFQSHLATLVS